MNKDAIEKRLGRPLDKHENNALRALAPIAEILGARDWGLGWMLDAEHGCTAHARWYGYTILPGARLSTQARFKSPEAAAEALGAAMLKSMSCTYCGRPVAAGLFRGCPWRRFGDHWRPGCRPAATPEGVLPLTPTPQTGKDQPQ